MLETWNTCTHGWAHTGTHTLQKAHAKTCIFVTWTPLARESGRPTKRNIISNRCQECWSECPGEFGNTVFDGNTLCVALSFNTAWTGWTTKVEVTTSKSSGQYICAKSNNYKRCALAFWLRGFIFLCVYHVLNNSKTLYWGCMDRFW